MYKNNRRYRKVRRRDCNGCMRTVYVKRKYKTKFGVSPKKTSRRSISKRAQEDLDREVSRNIQNAERVGDALARVVELNPEDRERVNKLLNKRKQLQAKRRAASQKASTSRDPLIPKQKTTKMPGCLHCLLPGRQSMGQILYNFV